MIDVIKESPGLLVLAFVVVCYALWMFVTRKR